VTRTHGRRQNEESTRKTVTLEYARNERTQLPLRNRVLNAAVIIEVVLLLIGAFLDLRLRQFPEGYASWDDAYIALTYASGFLIAMGCVSWWLYTWMHSSGRCVIDKRSTVMTAAAVGAALVVLVLSLCVYPDQPAY